MSGTKVTFRPPKSPSQVLRVHSAPSETATSSSASRNPRRRVGGQAAERPRHAGPGVPAMYTTASLASPVSGAPSSCLPATPATSSLRIGTPVPSMERYMRGSSGLASTTSSRPERCAAAPGLSDHRRSEAGEASSPARFATCRPAAPEPMSSTVSAMTPAIPGVTVPRDVVAPHLAVPGPVPGEPVRMPADQRRMRRRPVLRKALQIRRRVRMPVHIAAIASRHDPRSFSRLGKRAAGRFAPFWSHAPAPESAGEKRGCQKLGYTPNRSDKSIIKNLGYTPCRPAQAAASASRTRIPDDASA